MRERDLNLNIRDEKELNRIKTILFPKKRRESSSVRQELLTPKAISTDNGINVRTQIEKLREEISCLLAKGRGNDIVSNNTERAYLDGISKLTKQLKNNASEINEVFDDFLAHLPTKLTNEPQHYQTNYYYSMLIQNVAWNKMTNILKQPLVDGFVAIKNNSEEKKVFETKLALVQSERDERNKARTYFNLGKYFSTWRYNNKCIKAKIESQEYLRENNLENDQKLMHSLLNLPLLVLMLEQLGSQASDISQLLILDESKSKACKFIEEGQSAINSSIETVTQRSLLQSERSNFKFSRFDINLTSSLTKHCIQTGEILFITNLSKSLDYSQIDNLCYWQSLGKSSSECLKGGVIFYPIFDIKQQCIGVLRQYFYEGTLSALTNKKLEKICVFLELGLKMEKRMRKIVKEKQYQREGYYMKMIGLIKRIELTSGNEKQSMTILGEQLKEKLGLSKMTIYKIKFTSEVNSKDILLKKLWGEGEDCNFILSLAHQLLKQHQNYTYIENRLIVYSNLMLFDLKVEDNIYTDPKNTTQTNSDQKRLLPIELIVSVLTKIQTILTIKQKEGREVIIKQQIIKEQQIKQQRTQLNMDFQQETLMFLSKSAQNQQFRIHIENYIRNVRALINRLSFSEKQEFESSTLYLQCKLGHSKRDRFFIKLGETHQQLKQQQRSQIINFLKVEITAIATLYCDIRLQKEGKHLISDIGIAIKTFMSRYIGQRVTKRKVNENYKEILRNFKKSELSITNFPLREQKRSWEINQMSLIYENFKEAVEKFIQSTFFSKNEVKWQKQRPNDTNIEDWKQSIYNLLLSSNEHMKLQVTNKNPLISFEEYNELRQLTNYEFPSIQEESILIITNKTKYRSKNMVYENSLIMKLPIYFHMIDEDKDEDNDYMRRKLIQLKDVFLTMCQSFINGANTFNQRFQSNAAKAIFVQYDKNQLSIKKEVFSIFKTCNIRHLQSLRVSNIFIGKLMQFQRKLLFQSFNSIYNSFQWKKEDKINKFFSTKQISCLCMKVNNLFFSKAFNQMKNLQANRNKVFNLVNVFESLNRSYQKTALQIHFCNLSKYKKHSKIAIFNEIIDKFSQDRLFYCFQQIKSIKEELQVDTFKFSEFENCKSLQELRYNLSQKASKYSLFLQINEDYCYTLYSPTPQLYHSFQTVQSTYTPSNSFISYQCGSEGQLIWNYQLNDDENCFQIKDRLNSMSKCIELGLKNSKKLMQFNLLRCSMLHRNWIKSLKTKYFKLWNSQSSHLEMLERNRLNDSLYQVSVETQTIKEKLKAQQKILKNNSSQSQQLAKKQEQYKNEIVQTNQKISMIEENHNKLENAKSIYNSLHRRGVLKTIFIQWRKNASGITLSLAQRQLKNNLSIKRMAFKSINNLYNTKKHQYLRVFIWSLSHNRKQATNKFKNVEKIDVMFEQRGARLITFQSQLEDQQNSNQYSNRTESDESHMQYNKRKFDRERSPLQKIELSAEEYAKHNNGAYKLNPKTLKFLKRMGKLQN